MNEKHFFPFIMFYCPLCTISYTEISLLINHLLYMHKYHSSNRFVCKQNNCYREFHKLIKFKEHLLNKHVHQQVHQNINVPLQKKLDFQIQNIDSDIENVHTQNEMHNNNFHDKEHLKLNKSIVIHDIKYQLKESASSFISTFYSDKNIHKHHVQKIVTVTNEFIKKEIILNLKENVKQILEEFKIDNCKIISNIEEIFHVYANPFQDLDSEYKRLQFFKKKSSFIEAENYVIGTKNISKRHKGQFSFTPMNAIGQFVSIKKILNGLFTIPGFLTTILNYIQILSKESNIIHNIIQAELYKCLLKQFPPDSIVLPLILFYDAFETQNPLGGHAGNNKMGATYFSLPCIPPQFYSKLDNIFLTLLFNEKDRVEFGNKSAFLPLITELKYLESNPVFKACNNKDIYICFILMTGDNLGIHEICGFVQSFVANFPCRVCKMSRDLLRETTTEIDTLLRTRTNYEIDLRLGDVSKTGINEECIFHCLENFNLFDNLAFDIMHDIFEGICRYDLSQILLHYIYEAKFFTLEELNNRLSRFDFGLENGVNRPPSLKKDKLKNYRLGFSSSETIYFVKYLGLLIGNLIPKDDKYWDLYVSLRAIIDILLARSITTADIEYLNVLITEHLEIYIQLFGKTLKLKFHNMLHYHRAIKRFGPLINIWCMRFEANHQKLKQYARITSNVNLPLSLVQKNQLMLNDRILKEFSFEEEVLFICDTTNKITNHPLFFNFKNCLPNSSLLLVKWIKLNNCIYKSNMILSLGVQDILPLLGIITIIAVNENDEFFFIIQNLQTLGFSSHFYAYEVFPTEHFSLLNSQDVCKCSFPLTKTIVDGHSYVVYD
jgi:hypothetical protein